MSEEAVSASERARRRRKFLLVAVTGAAIVACGGGHVGVEDAAHADHRATRTPPRAVVVVSMDGLRPDYVRDRRDMLPTLGRVAREGAVAHSLESVWPSVTYPAHTTMVTGVTPSKHGIVNNVVFDPFEKNDGGWYWYASDIRVETIWDVAEASGIAVANATWPVTVGASIRYNLPQFWRSKTGEDDKLLAVLSTPGLAAELTAKGRALPAEHRPDRARAEAAAALITAKSPGLVLAYLADLDTVQHHTGPASPETWAALADADANLATIVDAARETYARFTLVVVSDHGFVPIERDVRPNVILRRAGLLDVTGQGKDTKAAAFRAITWKAGGSAAIMLRDPGDIALRERVKQLFVDLARDPESGIAAVLDGATVERVGGFPGAAIVLSAAPGAAFSERFDEPMIVPSKYRGTHGYDPKNPEMGASLILWGDGIRPGTALGDIPMIDVAPTIAALLGVSLPRADGKAISAALLPSR